MLKSKNILAIGAHADDVEIGCGGTVALHVKRGDNVIILVMAEPFFTNYDGKVLRPREIGDSEEKNAAEVLGAKLINLGFKDNRVMYSVETIEAINRIIDEYKIDTVYTHWHHESNQDHSRTSHATISAARYTPNIFMYEPMFPNGKTYESFRSQVYVNITSTFNIKMKSLECHKSQLDKFGSGFLEAIEARARYRGYEIGSKYAESFELIRSVEDL
ncbi:MAG: PIG-L family deacetylase [Candidatus Methanoperedens sp.]|nr:PIG-L family deacetylase [Candidatus Methanoperedens sp.]